MERKDRIIKFDNGEQYRIISVKHLSLVSDEINKFRAENQINDFQNWIVTKLYRFDLPDVAFPIKSVLLIAVPHPMYAPVVFTCKGREYSCRSLVSSDFEKTKEAVLDFLGRNGNNGIEAQNLPLKRLAVHSGLAVYGKNNITYIKELGSNFSFMAFFTDLVCSDTEWITLDFAPSCADCNICRKACPTGAIRKDRFLIDNQICLSCLNESGEPFPDWLPLSVHHTLYDCLKCQIACPMNKEQRTNLGKTVKFSEEEIDLLICGDSFGKYTPAMREKVKYLGLDQWPEGISKNIKALMAKQERGL